MQPSFNEINIQQPWAKYGYIPFGVQYTQNNFSVNQGCKLQHGLTQTIIGTWPFLWKSWTVYTAGFNVPVQAAADCMSLYSQILYSTDVDQTSWMSSVVQSETSQARCHILWLRDETKFCTKHSIYHIKIYWVVLCMVVKAYKNSTMYH
jgi:hypothetical protein